MEFLEVTTCHELAMCAINEEEIRKEESFPLLEEENQFKIKWTKKPNASKP